MDSEIKHCTAGLGIWEWASKDESGYPDKLLDHQAYINKHGEDLPEIRNWKWSPGKAGKISTGRHGVPAPRI